MSRQIKFRGFTEGRFITPLFYEGKWYADWRCFEDAIEFEAPVDQWTGLQDKNGKDIYERDIFDAHHDFGPGGFQNRRASVGFHKEHGYQWNYWDLKTLVVIGNIHESPHLLALKAEEMK